MNTTWPDGVLHRFLGLCGATADIRKQGRDHTGTCSGCPDNIEYATLTAAAAWGQKHAGICRGLPRPDETSTSSGAPT
jgi:hypothetical protein